MAEDGQTSQRMNLDDVVELLVYVLRGLGPALQAMDALCDRFDGEVLRVVSTEEEDSVAFRNRIIAGDEVIRRLAAHYDTLAQVECELVQLLHGALDLAGGPLTPAKSSSVSRRAG